MFLFLIQSLPLTARNDGESSSGVAPYLETWTLTQAQVALYVCVFVYVSVDI